MNPSHAQHHPAALPLLPFITWQMKKKKKLGLLIKKTNIEQLYQKWGSRQNFYFYMIFFTLRFVSLFVKECRQLTWSFMRTRLSSRLLAWTQRVFFRRGLSAHFHLAFKVYRENAGSYRLHANLRPFLVFSVTQVCLIYPVCSYCRFPCTIKWATLVYRLFGALNAEVAVLDLTPIEADAV